MTVAHYNLRYIHTHHPRSIPEGVAGHFRSPETPTCYRNDLAMSYNADVTGITMQQTKV
jgi:hypothetical protein